MKLLMWVSLVAVLCFGQASTAVAQNEGMILSGVPAKVDTNR